MPIRRCMFVGGSCLVSFALQAHVWAEPPANAASSQEARTQQRAAAAPSAARALHPSAASCFASAQAYEAQGNAPRALAMYREYLRRAPSAQDRSAVNTKIATLTARVGERRVQQVTFLAAPPGATVRVDSEPIGAAPITLELRPGSHRVEFRSAGYASADFTFELKSDRALDVSAKLTPVRRTPVAVARADRSSNAAGHEVVSAAAAAHAWRARTDAEESGERRSSVTRTLGFAALGASVAALGGAVTFEVMRSHAENEARKETNPVEVSEASERMKARQTMARVFAGAGGALAALGGVLLVVANANAGGTEQASGNRGVAFGCLPSKCHASYRGAF